MNLAIIAPSAAGKNRAVDAARDLVPPEAYYLADFEGCEGGWLGAFVRDILEPKLREYRDGDSDEEDEE